MTGPAGSMSINACVTGDVQRMEALTVQAIFDAASSAGQEGAAPILALRCLSLSQARLAD
jgi:hypothetical protein